MPPSPSHATPRRPLVSPPKSQPQPSASGSSSSSATTFSPRRPVALRSYDHSSALGSSSSSSPSSSSSSCPPSAGSRLATSLALATQDSLHSAASPTGSAAHYTRSSSHGNYGPQTTSSRGSHGSDSGNPHVRAIQSRVAELVRRFDESVASSSTHGDDDDDDDGDGDTVRLNVPARWRVGDVLLATHSSLAKTSTRTERAMLSDFGDDVDVTSVIGEGEQRFSLVLRDAAQQAEQMKTMLAKTLSAVQQMQLQDERDSAAAKGDGASVSQTMRDLKTTAQALHKEKAMLIAQLHDHLKSNKELLATMEDQNQELKKAQIAVAMKCDELKSVRDEFAFRMAELTKMSETSQQNVTLWRDKYQSTLKTLGDAEQTISELDAKVQTQSEEVMKHDFVSRAKNSELEKAKEKLKDSEAARMRAESDRREAVAQAAMAAGEAAAATKRADAATASAAAGKAKTTPAPSAGGTGMTSKEKLELESKLRQQELTIRDLQMRLSELTNTRSKFEQDNNELSRIVRELQARAQEMMSSSQPAAPLAKLPVLQRVTSFALSFKRKSPGSQRQGDGDNDGTEHRTAAAQEPSDDLSTASEDEGGEGDGDGCVDADPEAEHDERELNETVLQIVTSVFPTARVSPMESQSDERISQSIAQYEADPLSHPLQVPVDGDSLLTSSRISRTATTTSGGASLSLSELEQQLRAAHVDEIARLKKQYVAGLLEYKKLVIEQYERRQHEIQQHHRLEIENLILVVQEKFKRELERRGERVLQAKESLKLLYRAMNMGNGGGSGGGGGGTRKRLGFVSEDGESEDDQEQNERDENGEPVPLKSILRAAVFAMSTSKRRNDEASSQISALHGNVAKTSKPPRPPVVKITIKTKSQQLPSPPATGVEPQAETVETDWAAFLQTMRGNQRHGNGGTSHGGGVASVHVGCQVEERDFVIFGLKGLRGNHVSPENVESYVLPSAALLQHHASNSSSSSSPSTDRSHGRGNGSGNGNGRNGVLSLTEGALLADSLVRELRALLPFLPPGAYYLSGALRHQLLIELLRFYSDLSRRHALPEQQQQRGAQFVVDDAGSDMDVEVVVGSPRDTPFLRRKAVEGMQRKKQQQRQRRDLLANGGLAMLQQFTPVAATAASSRAGYARLGFP